MTIYVAGGDTLIGSALVRRLRRGGWSRLAGADGGAPDLTDAAAVDAFFRQARPEYVFHAGGRSGGIAANVRHPADLMVDNLLAAAHVVRAAHDHGARKLLYLASSCGYPRLSPQPMAEGQLLAGPPEPTSEAYALAKLAGWKLCQAYRRQYGDDFIVGFPANAYGAGDDFSPEGGHVVPALIRRAHEARQRGAPSLTVWGTGTPRREFVHADDLADACLFVMENYSDEAPVNLGGGGEVSVRELAEAVCRVVGFTGRLEFDATRPDGAPRKALDAGRLAALGWRPGVSLDAGLAATYRSFLGADGRREIEVGA